MLDWEAEACVSAPGRTQLSPDQQAEDHGETSWEGGTDRSGTRRVGLREGGCLSWDRSEEREGRWQVEWGGGKLWELNSMTLNLNLVFLSLGLRSCEYRI